jgi:hypothetical protein
MKTHGVICVGQREVSHPFPGVRKTQYVRPCGWTGRRRAYDIDGTPIVNRDIPCPRCGGEVELRPKGGAS